MKAMDTATSCTVRGNFMYVKTRGGGRRREEEGGGGRREEGGGRRGGGEEGRRGGELEEQKISFLHLFIIAG